jgi:hypothetical protein
MTATTRQQAFVCAALAIALAGCSVGTARSADRPALYSYDLGEAWTTRKRRVHLYQCRTGSKVCRGPASYLDVLFQCRCE